MPLTATWKNVPRGPFSKLLFTISNNFGNSRRVDPHNEDVVEITLDDTADIRFRFEQYLPDDFDRDSDTTIPLFVFITVKKHPLVKASIVQLNVTCKELNYSEQISCTEKWLQNIDIGDTKCEKKGMGIFMSKELEIYIGVRKVETVTFAGLYDDTTLTDFHLSTAEGTVAIHKVCLAAHSDVFKRMFSGTWKETLDGRIEIQGVTLSTLQHLKEYVYLGTLPDDGGLRPLLLLASYYFIEILKKDCIGKLVKSITSENLYSLLELACENNIPELTFAILLQTPDAIVDATYQIEKKKSKLKVNCDVNEKYPYIS